MTRKREIDLEGHPVLVLLAITVLPWAILLVLGYAFFCLIFPQLWEIAQFIVAWISDFLKGFLGWSS